MNTQTQQQQAVVADYDKGKVTYNVAGQDVTLSFNIVRKYLLRGNSDVSDQDLMQFISICKFNQLNPFLNEAYLVAFKSSTGTVQPQMIVSKEAFAKRAEASEHYQGLRAGIIVQDKEKVVEVCEVVNNVTDRIDENRKEQQDNSLSGIPTGFPRYDFTTGGFHPGNLVVIGGDNSQGKTSLALSIALFALKMGRKSAIYSLEMTNEELVARMLSMELNVPGLTSNKILYNKLSDEDVKNIHLNKHKIADLPLYFDDRSKSSLDNIIRSATLNVPKYKLDFIVIDYLQILSFSKKGQTTEEVLSEATRRLKQLAIDLKICVILLSQINRDKNDPEPQKNRLKGSSGIEANADNIILVYRPEVYGKNLTYSQPEYKDVSPINTALIKVAKGRNIGIFDFIVGFDGEHTRFYALDEYSLPSIRNNNFNNTPQPQQEEEQKFVPFVDEETEYTAF